MGASAPNLHYTLGFILEWVYNTPEMSTEQPNNALHNITLEKLLTALVETYGWEQLGTEIKIRCFTHDPSIKSSLTFLRRTPWAREKVENLYVLMMLKKERTSGSAQ